MRNIKLSVLSRLFLLMMCAIESRLAQESMGLRQVPASGYNRADYSPPYVPDSPAPQYNEPYKEPYASVSAAEKQALPIENNRYGENPLGYQQEFNAFPAESGAFGQQETSFNNIRQGPVAESLPLSELGALQGYQSDQRYPGIDPNAYEPNAQQLADNSQINKGLEAGNWPSAQQPDQERFDPFFNLREPAENLQQRIDEGSQPFAAVPEQYAEASQQYNAQIASPSYNQFGQEHDLTSQLNTQNYGQASNEYKPASSQYGQVPNQFGQELNLFGSDRYGQVPNELEESQNSAVLTSEDKSQIPNPYGLANAQPLANAPVNSPDRSSYDANSAQTNSLLDYLRPNSASYPKVEQDPLSSPSLPTNTEQAHLELPPSIPNPEYSLTGDRLPNHYSQQTDSEVEPLPSNQNSDQTGYRLPSLADLLRGSQQPVESRPSELPLYSPSQQFLPEPQQPLPQQPSAYGQISQGSSSNIQIEPPSTIYGLYNPGSKGSTMPDNSSAPSPMDEGVAAQDLLPVDQWRHAPELPFGETDSSQGAPPPPPVQPTELSSVWGDRPVNVNYNPLGSSLSQSNTLPQSPPNDNAQPLGFTDNYSPNSQFPPSHLPINPSSPTSVSSSVPSPSSQLPQQQEQPMDPSVAAGATSKFLYPEQMPFNRNDTYPYPEQQPVGLPAPSDQTLTNPDTANSPPDSSQSETPVPSSSRFGSFFQNLFPGTSSDTENSPPSPDVSAGVPESEPTDLAEPRPDLSPEDLMAGDNLNAASNEYNGQLQGAFGTDAESAQEDRYFDDDDKYQYDGDDDDDDDEDDDGFGYGEDDEEEDDEEDGDYFGGQGRLGGGPGVVGSLAAGDPGIVSLPNVAPLSTDSASSLYPSRVGGQFVNPEPSVPSDRRPYSSVLSGGLVNESPIWPQQSDYTPPLPNQYISPSSDQTELNNILSPTAQLPAAPVSEFAPKSSSILQQIAPQSANSLSQFVPPSADLHPQIVPKPKNFPYVSPEQSGFNAPPAIQQSGYIPLPPGTQTGYAPSFPDQQSAPPPESQYAANALPPLSPPTFNSPDFLNQDSAYRLPPANFLPPADQSSEDAVLQTKPQTGYNLPPLGSLGDYHPSLAEPLQSSGSLSESSLFKPSTRVKLDPAQEPVAVPVLEASDISAQNFSADNDSNVNVTALEQWLEETTIDASNNSLGDNSSEDLAQSLLAAQRKLEDQYQLGTELQSQIEELQANMSLTSGPPTSLNYSDESFLLPETPTGNLTETLANATLASSNVSTPTSANSSQTLTPPQDPQAGQNTSSLNTPAVEIPPSPLTPEQVPPQEQDQANIESPGVTQAAELGQVQVKTDGPLQEKPDAPSTELPPSSSSTTESDLDDSENEFDENNEDVDPRLGAEIQDEELSVRPGGPDTEEGGEQRIKEGAEEVNAALAGTENSGSKDDGDGADTNSAALNDLKTAQARFDEEDVPSSGHFMAYFVTTLVLVIMGYLFYHNRKKVVGYIVEGRNGRKQRRGGNGYKQLSTNVEEAMPSLEKDPDGQKFIY